MERRSRGEKVTHRRPKGPVRTGTAPGPWQAGCPPCTPLSQVPVKSGSRLSMKALIASMRSLEMRNDEFHCAM